jgi:hypothetical protein
MRLPQTPDSDRPIAEMIHYLTDYYAMKKFNINPITFNNSSDTAFYSFYGEITKISGEQAIHLRYFTMHSSPHSLYYSTYLNCKHFVIPARYQGSFE